MTTPADKKTTATAKKGTGGSSAKAAPNASAKDATAKAVPAALAKAPRVPAPKMPVGVEDDGVAVTKAKGAGLKMKDLVEQVAKAATGGKKKGVKEIVEATLAALGDALAKGEAVNLPGFGRAKVAHAEDKGAGKPMTIKMKSQPAGAPKKPKKETLAEPVE
jgi:nucleoid DNA-binding protein